MLLLRRADERLHTRSNGQDTWHTFFPCGSKDPLSDGFGPLRVLDEIRLTPGTSATPYPPQDAEVLTYVLAGTLAQSDSIGHSGVLRTMDFQHVSTVQVSLHERNASTSSAAHFLKVSLSPSDLPPGQVQEQRMFTLAERRGSLCLVASPDGRRGTLQVHQDALIYSAVVDEGHHLAHSLPPESIAWLQVIRGKLNLGEIVLAEGDGVGFASEQSLSITPIDETEVLLIVLSSGARAVHEALRRAKDQRPP